MTWYVRAFDPNWVRCANHLCRAEFTARSIVGKRKCPRCKMDNQHCLAKPKHSPQHPLSSDGGESTAQSSAVACHNVEGNRRPATTDLQEVNKA